MSTDTSAKRAAADLMFDVRPSPHDEVMLEFGYRPNVMRTGWVNSERDHHVIHEEDIGSLLTNSDPVRLRELLTTWTTTGEWRIPRCLQENMVTR
jgi:hypothetical protein